MSSICRLCGLPCEQSIDIFDRPNAVNLLQYKIKHLLDITVGLGDNLPHSVCLRCESRLESLWIFRNTCHQVQIKLRKTYKTNLSIIRSTQHENEWYTPESLEPADLLGYKEESHKYPDDISKQKLILNIDSASIADIVPSVSNTIETTLIHSRVVDNDILGDDYNCNIEEDDSMSIASEENAGCSGIYDPTEQTTSTLMNISSIENDGDKNSCCSSSSTSEKQNDKNSTEISPFSATISSEIAKSFEGHYYRMETDMNSDLLCNRVPFLLVESSMGTKHTIYTVNPNISEFDQKHDNLLNSGELGLYLTMQTYESKNPIVARTLIQWVNNLLKGEISLMPYYFSWLDDNNHSILAFKCVICKHILSRNRQIVMNHIADHLLWNCPVCDIFLNNVSRLKIHLRQHDHESVTFECSTCNRKFCHDVEEYKAHVRSHYKFECSFCQFECSDEAKWLMHLKEDRAKSCSSDCCLFYETISEFQEHVARLATIGGYVCGACGIAYHCETYLKLHLRVHGLEHGNKSSSDSILTHSQNEILEKINRIINSNNDVRFDTLNKVLDNEIDVNDFKCSSTACGGRVYSGFKCFICRSCKILESEKLFRVHIEGHFMMTCLMMKCKRIFNNMKRLEMHLKVHRIERRICKHCKKDVWLDTSEEYIEHLTLHKQRRICVYCQDVFPHSKRLSNHVRNHEEGIVKYFCKYCNETVVGSHNKNVYNRVKISHLKEKHPDKLEKTRHVCEICGKVSSSLSGLSAHKKMHKTKDNDVLICAYCNKEFCRKSSLIFHIQQHMNEKGFKCDICDKSFNRRSSLQKHKLDMHSVKKHVCNECGKRFTYPSAMRDHMKRAHALLRSTKA